MDLMLERSPKKQCTTASRIQAGSEAPLHHCPKRLSTLMRESVLISPPVSPETLLDSGHIVAEKPQRNAQDLVLYPDDPVAETTESNLFVVNPFESVLCRGATKNGGNASRPPQSFEPFSGSFYKTRISSLYNRNTSQYLKQLRRDWSSDVRDSQKSIDQVRKPDRASRGKEPVLPPRPQNAPGSSSRPETLQSKAASSRSAVPPLPPTQTVDNRTTKKRVEDTDFEALENFCPAMSDLINPKALRADWSGSPIDLSCDPYRNHLNEMELGLASTLRLSCATYLCSKRRIFLARVQCLSEGREFRKTDAQQACKIDVNKASKLWTAFENSGWFRDELLARWLPKPSSLQMNVQDASNQKTSSRKTSSQRTGNQK